MTKALLISIFLVALIALMLNLLAGPAGAAKATLSATVPENACNQCLKLCH